MSDLEGRAKAIFENFIADPSRLPSLPEDERQIRRPLDSEGLFSKAALKCVPTASTNH